MSPKPGGPRRTNLPPDLRSTVDTTTIGTIVDIVTAAIRQTDRLPFAISVTCRRGSTDPADVSIHMAGAVTEQDAMWVLASLSDQKPTLGDRIDRDTGERPLAMLTATDAAGITYWVAVTAFPDPS